MGWFGGYKSEWERFWGVVVGNLAGLGEVKSKSFGGVLVNS